MTIKYKLAISSFVLAVSTVSICRAQAWSNTSGVISGVTLSGPTNEAFRVSINRTNVGGCIGGFLYINTSNGNYQAYVAALLSAYAQQKAVLLSYVVDSNGFCQMQDIAF